MSIVVMAIYFWRLMSCSLPPRAAIISTFVPVGPVGMGAFSIQNLSVGLAMHLTKHQFILQRDPHPPADPAILGSVAEGIHWTGIIVALFLLGIGSFFLVEAIAGVWNRLPKTFNVGRFISLPLPRLC